MSHCHEAIFFRNPVEQKCHDMPIPPHVVKDDHSEIKGKKINKFISILPIVTNALT